MAITLSPITFKKNKSQNKVFHELDVEDGFDKGMSIRGSSVPSIDTGFSIYIGFSTYTIRSEGSEFNN
jgi:hypothetical protein